MTFNIIGLPDETVEDALETVRLNIKIGTRYPRSSMLMPYSGTRIAEERQTEYRPRLYNIHYFFQTAVIFPWTLNLLRLLIRLPPNILFKLWWATIYFFIFTKAERRSFIQTFILFIRNSRTIFKKKD